MTHTALANEDWEKIVDRLGGAGRLEIGARETKALVRARVIAGAVDLLRLVLAYCLGERSLRSTAAWASAVGLADISNGQKRRQVIMSPFPPDPAEAGRRQRLRRPSDVGRQGVLVEANGQDDPKVRQSRRHEGR